MKTIEVYCMELIGEVQKITRSPRPCFAQRVEYSLVDGRKVAGWVHEQKRKDVAAAVARRAESIAARGAGAVLDEAGEFHGISEQWQTGTNAEGRFGLVPVPQFEGPKWITVEPDPETIILALSRV